LLFSATVLFLGLVVFLAFSLATLLRDFRIPSLADGAVSGLMAGSALWFVGVVLAKPGSTVSPWVSGGS
jgi:hypothetical protein